MPSRPRLSTPARSTTSSPAAASSSGVEAVITVSRTASNNMGGFRSGDEPEAVEDQGVAGEHVEQQDALEDLGEVERHLQADLRTLAPDEGQRQEQCGDENPHRMQAAEERHD